MTVGMRRSMVLLPLWVAVSTGFFLWRLPVELIWCDTVVVANNLYEEPNPVVWRNPGTLEWIVHNSFYDVGADGYRPLSRIIFWTGTALFSDLVSHSHLYFATVGMLFGTLAVCFFLVGRRFLHSETAALFAVLIFLFSTPVVTGAWNVICGIQALVPLLICLGLLCYWGVIDSSKRCKSWYMAGLCAVFFIGPWFREFIGLLPLLIIFLEVQRVRRPTFIMSVAVVFFLHSVFPAAIVKLTVYPGLPVYPVYAMGHLGHQVAANMATNQVFSISKVVSELRWETIYHFLTLYPSVLFVLSLIALLLRPIQLLPALIPFLLRVFNKRRLNPSPLPMGFLPSLLFLLAGIYIYFATFRQDWLLLWVFAGFICFAVSRNLFLACWFLLFLMPFLKIFTEQVHLAYALLPASIIIAAAVEELWRSVRFPGFMFTAARYALYSVVVLAIADHSLNPYNSYRVVQSINNGIMKMAHWFRSNVPAGSIVVTNVLHGEDIRLFSNGHMKVLWTVRAGIPRDKDAVDEPSAMEELLKENQSKRDVYFLNVDFNYPLEKLDYHSHKYVRNRSVDVNEIGLVHTIQVRYPFIDPLKQWVPRAYIAFLGAPDLENDFYRGPAQDGTPFVREIYAEYHVYQVTGTKLAAWNPNIPWNFVEDGYKGFNIFKYGDRYLALAQALGPVDLQKLNMRVVNDYQDRNALILGSSLEEVKRVLNQLSNRTGLQRGSTPILLEEGYRGFNLIGYDTRIYAIPQAEGAFEIERIKRNEYGQWFSATSLDEVKRLIDQSLKDQRS